MLGPDLLVALVVEPGATERLVRFPGDGEWIDIWTGALYRGGTSAAVAAPLDGPPPLFARAGSGILEGLAW